MKTIENLCYWFIFNPTKEQIEFARREQLNIVNPNENYHQAKNNDVKMVFHENSEIKTIPPCYRDVDLFDNKTIKVIDKLETNQEKPLLILSKEEKLLKEQRDMNERNIAA